MYKLFKRKTMNSINIHFKISQNDYIVVWMKEYCQDCQGNIGLKCLGASSLDY